MQTFECSSVVCFTFRFKGSDNRPASSDRLTHTTMERLRSELFYLKVMMRKEQKATQRKERGQELRRNSLLRSAVIVYAHLPGEVTQCAKYLMMNYSGLFHGPESSIQHDIEVVYTDTDAETSAAWLEWSPEKATPTQLRTAKRWIHELHVLQWVEQQKKKLRE